MNLLSDWFFPLELKVWTKYMYMQGFIIGFPC